MLGLLAPDLKVDKFGQILVREDPVAIPPADFLEAQFLREALNAFEITFDGRLSAGRK